MAQQEEIVLWIDRRWKSAIEKHLKDENLQEHLENVLDELFAAELAVKSAEVSVQNSLGLQKALIQKYLTGATIV